jgi:hypothetical protein
MVRKLHDSYLYLLYSLLAYCFVVLDFVRDSITSASVYELYMDRPLLAVAELGAALRAVCAYGAHRADRNGNKGEVTG